MGLRRTNFSVDEWYHCYNRGVDKRAVFESAADYERFLQLLYLTNTSASLHRSNIYLRDTEQILTLPRVDTLVSIGAFCLMQNHFHLLIKETRENGISTFMQKLGTAYTMYFNIKNGHVGNLFYKPFRSRHVDDDQYFQRVIRYIHLNPAELSEHGWKHGSVCSTKDLERSLYQYRYSSLSGYINPEEPLRHILGSDGFESYESVSVQAMIDDAKEYYAELAESDVLFAASSRRHRGRTSRRRLAG